MEKYLTTREVANYLRLNEKKVYALVAEGQLPAARISGKWLFPRQLVDQWVEHNTIYPFSGLMGAVLNDMLVIQGSDDWLFSKVAARFQTKYGVPVASANVGSLAGLAAIGAGKAHLAGCHVENEQVEKLAGDRWGCYLFNLLQRSQGIIFDRNRQPDISGLAVLATKGYRFAERQPLSGTYRLVERLLSEARIEPDKLNRAGTYSSHLELALAIRTGQADAGIGIQIAADLCGLNFLPLASEPYKLAIPLPFSSHPQIARFLEFITAELKTFAKKGVSGYGFEGLGLMEAVGVDPKKGQ
ncbi:MAG: helix-turn-helix transcriptional regulator [Deltaproteobacteria bacterium]|nr:helix-turn-helix transcriptional regulator [Deltaproteobacteria bacterium]